MTLHDVAWADPVNILVVSCCSGKFAWPSNISLVRCPSCRREELWHEVDPKGGIWCHPVMRNECNG